MRKLHQIIKKAHLQELFDYFSRLSWSKELYICHHCLLKEQIVGKWIAILDEWWIKT